MTCNYTDATTTISTRRDQINNYISVCVCVCDECLDLTVGFLSICEFPILEKFEKGELILHFYSSLMMHHAHTHFLV